MQHKDNNIKYRIIMILQTILVLFFAVVSYFDPSSLFSRYHMFFGACVFAIPHILFFKYNDTREPCLSKNWVNTYLLILSIKIFVPTVAICLLISHLLSARYTLYLTSICAILGFLFGKLGYHKFKRDFDKELDKEEVSRKELKR